MNLGDILYSQYPFRKKLYIDKLLIKKMNLCLSHQISLVLCGNFEN